MIASPFIMNELTDERQEDPVSNSFLDEYLPLAGEEIKDRVDGTVLRVDRMREGGSDGEFVTKLHQSF